MSVHELQIKALGEWYDSNALQREFATPEYCWSEKYQRVYCPGCRANFAYLYLITPMPQPISGGDLALAGCAQRHSRGA